MAIVRVLNAPLAMASKFNQILSWLTFFTLMILVLNSSSRVAAQVPNTLPPVPTNGCPSCLPPPTTYCPPPPSPPLPTYSPPPPPTFYFSPPPPYFYPPPGGYWPYNPPSPYIYYNSPPPPNPILPYFPYYFMNPPPPDFSSAHGLGVPSIITWLILSITILRYLSS